ncbi:MAG: U32 family peptidase, partial [Ruminococcus sp.]|nr:U32 family peptidase [Ruminococcus sp.]
MNKIEILSPCGGFDSIVAAVRSGADAVYLGAKDFSARASAKNFSIDELKDAVKYCHINGVKVYLALNTLIFDDEMDDALDLVRKAAECDIDALITQDIGLAMAVKKIVPQLKLHASTQMSVHTLSGAKALKELGFSRVVLAREMTKEEIKYIADNCDIELEVFVHGALCMCVSGQCYMSAALGTRSANRGMCAQPCRLPFTCDSSNTHALSLKDNSIIDRIRELQEIGVKSAKIEGRMKRPEYVSSATRACVMMRDNGYIDEKTQENLKAVFSRTGFTDGYFCDSRGSSMFGYRKREDVVLASEKLLRLIRSTYKDELRRVDIDFSVNIEVGKPVKLSVTDYEHSVQIQSDFIVSKAQNAPINAEKISSYLRKTGDTPYNVHDIKCEISGEAFISAKDINCLRRDILDKLSLKRERRHNYEVLDYTFTDLIGEIESKEFLKSNRAVLSDLNIPQSFSEFEYVFLPLFECVKNEEKIKEYQKASMNIAIEIPRAMFSLETKIYQALLKAKDMGIHHVLCHNIGAVYMCKELGLHYHLGFGMNITNSLSLLWAKNYGATDAEVSFELDYKRIDLLKSAIPIGVFSYGYLPLMITRNCPVKSGVHTCATCKNNLVLQDRKGEKFRLKCNKIVTEILNCVPLILAEDMKKSKNIVFNVLHFTVENSVENKEKTLEKLGENQRFERFTYGLYIRGVKNFTI